MVIGSHRSGSTLLCSLMAQTGALGKPDEFFKKKPYPHWEVKLDRPEARCEVALEYGTSPNGVCAMKLFSTHFVQIQDRITLQEWFPQPVFVWILRRDLLGQAISAVIAKQTNRYRHFRAGSGAEPVYSAEEIQQRLEWIAVDEARWRVYLARTGQAYQSVYYEDLLKSPEHCIRKLAAFAGVSVENARVEKDSVEVSGLRVQRTAINQEWRERFRAEMGNANELQMKLEGRGDGRVWRSKRLGIIFKCLGLS